MKPMTTLKDDKILAALISRSRYPYNGDLSDVLNGNLHLLNLDDKSKEIEIRWMKGDDEPYIDYPDNLNNSTGKLTTEVVGEITYNVYKVTLGANPQEPQLDRIAAGYSESLATSYGIDLAGSMDLAYKPTLLGNWVEGRTDLNDYAFAQFGLMASETRWEKDGRRVNGFYLHNLLDQPQTLTVIEIKGTGLDKVPLNTYKLVNAQVYGSTALSQITDNNVSGGYTYEIQLEACNYSTPNGVDIHIPSINEYVWKDTNNEDMVSFGFAFSTHENPGKVYFAVVDKKLSNISFSDIAYNISSAIQTNYPEINMDYILAPGIWNGTFVLDGILEDIGSEGDKSINIRLYGANKWSGRMGNIDDYTLIMVDPEYDFALDHKVINIGRNPSFLSDVNYQGEQAIIHKPYPLITTGFKLINSRVE